VHDRAVRRDRIRHAQLLELAHQRDVRVDVRVPAAHFENAFRLGLALLALQRRDVLAEERIVQRGDELGIVVVVAEVAVAVGIGPDADLRLPEAVGGGVLAHLADGDLAGAVAVDLVGLRERGVDRGAVREQRVRRIAQVLEIDLPVAVIGVLEHAAGDLDLAVGRAIDHVVERRRHVTEGFLEARSVLRPAGEDEAAIALHPRHRQHAEFGIFRIEALRVTVIERHCLDPAVEVVGPTVIAAGEFRRVALVGGHDHGAAVGALVVDHAHLSLVVAHQHDRLASHARGEIVAGLFDLALVPDVNPGGVEDALHLELEDGGIGVDATVHATGCDQARKLGVDVAHRLIPLVLMLFPMIPHRSGDRDATSPARIQMRRRTRSLPSPLWGGSARSAGVGVVRRSADGPPPPNPSPQGGGEHTECAACLWKDKMPCVAYVPVGRCSAVFVRCRTTHCERPAQPSAIACRNGGHVAGRPRR